MAPPGRVIGLLGGYYVATGLAPFVSRRAFEAVTGPKQEWWLVQAVGALVTVAGSAMVSAARRGRVTQEITGLAVGCAASLAAIDAVYVARSRISPVYLADAAVELAALVALARVSGPDARGLTRRLRGVQRGDAAPAADERP